MAAQALLGGPGRGPARRRPRRTCKLVFVPDAAGRRGRTAARADGRSPARRAEPAYPTLPDADDDGRRAAVAAARRQPDSPLHLRHLHRRAIEPVCARGVPRRRGNAVAFVQPAVHSRRRRSRQDALDARDRPLRGAASSRPGADLHLVRAFHERDDQRRALRSHSRFPIALSQRRRAARRRHSVRLGQGRHAERVLPHVQRAARRAEADRHQQRPSAP